MAKAALHKHPRIVEADAYDWIDFKISALLWMGKENCSIIYLEMDNCPTTINLFLEGD